MLQKHVIPKINKKKTITHTEDEMFVSCPSYFLQLCPSRKKKALLQENNLFSEASGKTGALKHLCCTG